MTAIINQLRHPRVVTGLAVITLMAGGLALRLANLSVYKFYPDSYQSLIVAHNIANHGSVVGRLGEQGMVYPGFFGWTRPLYSLLINLVTAAGWERLPAAYVVAVAAGVLAIPAAYLVAQTIFASRATGLSAALLVALSFSHVVWGGFIMTETTGVLIMLLLLWSLFRRLHRPAQLADPGDFMTGLLLAAAILARYEYAVVIIPITYLIVKKSPQPWVRLVNIAAMAVFVLALAVSWLFPVPALGAALAAEAARRTAFIAIMVALVAAGLLASRLVPPERRGQAYQHLGQGVVGLLWLLSAYLLLQTYFPTVFRWLATPLAAPREFLATEPLMGLTFLIGLTVAAGWSKRRTLMTFCLLAIGLLAATYYQVNPEMQRYWTHLIPFMVIPASFGLHQTVKWTTSAWQQRRGLPLAYAAAAALLLVPVQAHASYRGIKSWHGGLWQQPGYEEVAARAVGEAAPSDVLLIVSFPEPYYLFSGRPTHSLADAYPFIYIDGVPDSQPVLVVQDMGMRDQFPRFSEVLDRHLQEFQTGQLHTGSHYRYQARIEPEEQPVRLYQLPLGELRLKLGKAYPRE
ncbi:glycosyltransferase family 39 protein [Candidatus Parcubacteria bacterium]|nr:glycosyltransferase family 39 protein [Candidatus Parcubacteria bacterium]